VRKVHRYFVSDLDELFTAEAQRRRGKISFSSLCRSCS